MMRLIKSPPQTGTFNMAMDQAIMEAVGEGLVLPTLRLYSWQPPCLSLGYAQRSRDVDFERLRQKGWTVVRRPTGGRAILHVDELTYSISVPQDHPLVEGDITTSYRRLSNALQKGLQILGMEIAAARHTRPTHISAVCFETPSDYEITANGKKLIGSAQVRKHKAVLQHGTLPLFGDMTRICDVLAFPDEEAREIAKRQVVGRATTVEAVLGRSITWEAAARALQTAFEEVFHITFEEAFLTPQESTRLEQLRYEVYESDLWTLKR